MKIAFLIGLFPVLPIVTLIAGWKLRGKYDKALSDLPSPGYTRNAPRGPGFRP